MNIVYDVVAAPLAEQLRDAGYKFSDPIDQGVAQNSLDYLNYLYVQGFLTDSEKLKGYKRLSEFVKSHIVPLKE